MNRVFVRARDVPLPAAYGIAGYHSVVRVTSPAFDPTDVEGLVYQEQVARASNFRLQAEKNARNLQAQAKRLENETERLRALSDELRSLSSQAAASDPRQIVEATIRDLEWVRADNQRLVEALAHATREIARLNGA